MWRFDVPMSNNVYISHAMYSSLSSVSFSYLIILCSHSRTGAPNTSSIYLIR